MPQALNPQASVTEGHIALGGNESGPLGSPSDAQDKAVEMLGANGVRIVARSRFYQTPAFPAGSGPDYVNSAASFQTELTPDALIAAIHRVEADLGRVRQGRWGSRSIDIDLLSADAHVRPSAEVWRHWHDLPLDRQRVEAPDDLILPHPRLHERAFVLVPLAEIAPTWRHPVLGLAVSEMLAALPDHEKAAILPL